MVESIPLRPPCTMCVQYRGGDQYRGGYLEHRGGYLEYRGDIIFCYLSAVEGYRATCGTIS